MTDKNRKIEILESENESERKKRKEDKRGQQSPQTFHHQFEDVF